MKIVTVRVTPKMASEWLKKNKENRHVRPYYVNMLSDSMMRGEWTLSHQPIAISTKGSLLDGQHRLMALVKSGMTLDMSVATDVDEKTYDTMDIGIKRSMSDIFGEDPYNMNTVNRICRVLFGYRFTPRESEPVYNKFIKPIRELTALHTKSNPKFFSSPIKTGAIAAILAGEDKDYVYESFKNFANFDAAKLPKVLLMLGKQIMGVGSGSATASHKIAVNQSQLIVRSFTAFHKATANYDRLTVKDPSVKMDEIRDLYRKAMGIKVK